MFGARYWGGLPTRSAGNLPFWPTARRPNGAIGEERYIWVLCTGTVGVMETGPTAPIGARLRCQPFGIRDTGCSREFCCWAMRLLLQLVFGCDYRTLSRYMQPLNWGFVGARHWFSLRIDNQPEGRTMQPSRRKPGPVPTPGEVWSGKHRRGVVKAGLMYSFGNEITHKRLRVATPLRCCECAG